jgi:hypothetical protein
MSLNSNAHKNIFHRCTLFCLLDVCLLQCLACLVQRKTKAVRTVCTPYPVFGVKPKANVHRPIQPICFLHSSALRPICFEASGSSQGVASRFLFRFVQHIFLIYTTALNGVMLSAYSNRVCCYIKRPQRKTNDAYGKEPKGSQQLRRCVKETAADTMLVSDGQQRIFISL